jgi:hypothetical protein
MILHTDLWLLVMAGGPFPSLNPVIKLERSGFAHPCCIAMRTRDFVERNHTFIPNHGKGKYGVDQWDVAQRISMRERGRVFLVELSEVRGPRALGSVFGGIVYHNFFSIRPVIGPDNEGVSRDEALRAWEEAKGKYLGDLLEARSEASHLTAGA